MTVSYYSVIIQHDADKVWDTQGLQRTGHLVRLRGLREPHHHLG